MCECTVEVKTYFELYTIFIDGREKISRTGTDLEKSSDLSKKN